MESYGVTYCQIVYDTEHYTGSFTMSDPDAAIDAAKYILIGWMIDERNTWDLPGRPTAKQRDAWNDMIGTSTVFVYRIVPGKAEPDEDDVIWDMNDEDLRAIGWEDICS